MGRAQANDTTGRSRVSRNEDSPSKYLFRGRRETKVDAPPSAPRKTRLDASRDSRNIHAATFTNRKKTSKERHVTKRERIVVNWPGRCRMCGEDVREGDWAWWKPRGGLLCEPCFEKEKT
jgi:hypothetical protein